MFRCALIVSIAVILHMVLPEGAQASTGTCARKRMGPGQDLHWVCVSPGADCGGGCACTNVSYDGILSYDTCECLPAMATGDDYDYSTGGSWLAPVDVDGAPHTTMTFSLQPGFGNALVVYADEDVLVTGGTVANEQTFTGSNDLTGGFSVTLGALAGPDSITASITDLDIVMTSYVYEGDPTGTNTIALAPDGPEARGWFRPSTGTLQFDEPVHCTATNALHGSIDYYFRPILTQAMDGKANRRTATPNPFTLLATGRFVPSPPVPVQHRSWANIKTNFR